VGTSLSLSAYRPRSSADDLVIEHFRGEVAVLRDRGYITSRAVPICRTPRGEYLAIIEWSTPTAVDEAHADDAVLAIWRAKEQLLVYLGPAELDRSEVPFVSYEVVADL